MSDLNGRVGASVGHNTHAPTLPCSHTGPSSFVGLALVLAVALLQAGCGEYPGVAHPMAGQAPPTAAVAAAPGVQATGAVVGAPSAAQGGSDASASSSATVTQLEAVATQLEAVAAQLAAVAAQLEAAAALLPASVAASLAAEASPALPAAPSAAPLLAAPVGGAAPAAAVEPTPVPAPPAPAAAPLTLVAPVTAGPPVAASGSGQVQLKDFVLEPNQLTVRAGPVRFQLLNRGRYTHDFRIRGSGFEQKSPLIGAGRELTWEVTLAPGEYEIACPVSDHADRGMRGTLVVVP